jgi:uncharacterized glyoxalase superfamily protein PhnB
MAKTKPIRDGFHTLTPHIICRGAEKALDFYKKAFGAEQTLRMPGPGGGLMHGEMRIGDSMLMLADENPQMGYKSPQSLGGSPVTLTLYVEDCDKAYKRAIDAGAKPVMPPADMFWGDRYAQVGDPFGYNWALASHQKDMTEAEMIAAGK